MNISDMNNRVDRRNMKCGKPVLQKKSIQEKLKSKNAYLIKSIVSILVNIK